MDILMRLNTSTDSIDKEVTTEVLLYPSVDFNSLGNWDISINQPGSHFWVGVGGGPTLKNIVSLYPVRTSKN